MNDLTATPAVRPSDDSLLHALVWLTRHHGAERSAESLLFNQPTSGPLDPPLALRVLDEAGYDASLVERRADDIQTLPLPAVLLMRGGLSCILLRHHAGDAAPYDVMIPGKRPHALALDAATIAAEYGGFALIATPRPATRSASANGTPRETGGLGLRNTSSRFAPCLRQATIAALLGNVLTLASCLVVGIAFDQMIPQQSPAAWWALAGGAAVALTIDVASRQIRSRLIDQVGKKADLQVGSQLFRRTLAVHTGHEPGAHGPHARALLQVRRVRDFFTSAALLALADLPFAALFIVAIFAIGGPLGWVAVAAVPPMLGIAALTLARLRRSKSAGMASQAELQAMLVESADCLEDLKAAGALGQLRGRYERAAAAEAEAALRARTVSGWTRNLSTAVQQLVTIVVLIWGVHLIQAGQLTGGALIGAVIFASRAIGSLGAAADLAARYPNARAAIKALDELMNPPLDRKPGQAFVPNHGIAGRLDVHDLSFAYPQAGAEPSPRVLANVSLRIEPGERVAIIGAAGSGKSTLLRLLGGLHAPSEGRIDVDGVDLLDIDPADFRSGVGFVSQEPRLFTGSLRDNVTMGRTGIDGQRLAETARLTGLERLIDAHPQGWDRPVGERGGVLSGGQRQQVALTRCLAAPSRLLLLDEPTRSMDAESETAFLRRLKEAAGTRTLVMATHRPAVLELAERLIVIDDGRVLHDGPKAQVLAALSTTRPGPATAPAAARASGTAPAPAASPTPEPVTA